MYKYVHIIVSKQEKWCKLDTLYEFIKCMCLHTLPNHNISAVLLIIL